MAQNLRTEWVGVNIQPRKGCFLQNQCSQAKRSVLKRQTLPEEMYPVILD